MSDYFAVPIVEGHGEVQAAPVLAFRILEQCRPGKTLRVNAPLRVKVGSFLTDKIYFSKYMELAARKAKSHPGGFVWILLDSEDDCPAHLGPQILNQAATVRADVLTIVTLAFREYETWFLAAARSLRGVGTLPLDLEAPDRPETIRDAKGWLGQRMASPYNEPNDQPLLTSRFSMEEAVRVPSFARLRRKFEWVFERADAEPGSV